MSGNLHPDGTCNNPNCQVCHPALALSPVPLFRQMLPPAPAAPRELEKVLVATPVEGWRAWTIVRNDTVTLTRELVRALANEEAANGKPFRALAEELKPRLAALAAAKVWDEPVMRARCLANEMPGRTFNLPFPPHDAPAASCQCGFWAVRDKDLVPNPAPIFAYGRVALWGRVIEFDNGWRGEYAKPLEIILPDGEEETAQALREFYGCEVRCEERKALSAQEALATAWGSAGAQVQRHVAQQLMAVTQGLPAPPAAPNWPPPRRRRWPAVFGVLASFALWALMLVLALTFEIGLWLLPGYVVAGGGFAYFGPWAVRP